MQRKTLKLLLLFTTLALSTTLTIMPPPVQAATILAASAITDATLTPGAEPFRMNITVANVQNLWGYQFILNYNTSILSALNAGAYPPFKNAAVPPEINDASGYVALQYYTYGGDPTGFSTVDPAQIAWIDFVADNYGKSVLHLHGPYDGSLLSDVYGQPILHEDVNGSFTNLVDIAVTHITLSRTTANKGELVNINVTMANEGETTATFSVTVHYDTTAIQTKTVTDLENGTSTTLQFTWDTTYMMPNTYTIKAEAEILQGESDTADNVFVDGSVTIVRPPGAPAATFTYSPEHPLVGEPTAFDASLSTADGGTIISYAWNFGDGTHELYISANLTDTAAHIYTTTGTYPVTLNVTDSEGKSDATRATVTVYSHDIAIIDVIPEEHEVKAGETLKINVTVANHGNLQETFDVTVRYNETEIQTKTVRNLAEGNSTTLTFNWNTTNVPEGTYIISAAATVEQEADPSDNELIGGTVTIRGEPQTPISTHIIVIAAAIMTIIAAIIVGIYVKMRKTETK